MNAFRIKPASPQKMGKIASMATLPLMAVVILLASRAMSTSAESKDPPREGTLIVANLAEQSFTLHDLAGELGTRTVTSPGAPHELLEHRGRIYATLGRANRVLELDRHAPGILRTLELAGEPHGIALFEDRLVISLDDSDAVVGINVDTFTTETFDETGDTPHTIAVADDTLFLTATRANLIQALGALTAETDTGALPESIVITGRYVVTANAGDGTVSVFDRTNLRTEGAVHTGGAPVRVIALDDTHVVVALSGNAEVAVIDLDKMKVTHREKAGARPDGLCLSPSKQFIAVVSNADNLARVYRLPSWTPVLALVTGDGPGACLWLPD